MSNQLKFIVLTTKDYIKELFRKWYWYLIVGLIFGGLAYLLHQRKQETYTAQASFMTNTDVEGGGSSLLQLAGQFGFGKGPEISSDKLVELLSTRKIIVSTLMQNGVVAGKIDLLANHYLELFEVDKEFEDYPETKDFRFTPKEIETFDFTENLLASHIYKTILKENLYAKASQNGIVRTSFNCKYEEFAQQFTEILIETLSEYYINRTVEKQRSNLDIITEKVDSIKGKMAAADGQLTSWYEKYEKRLKAQSVEPKAYMRKVQLERDAEISSKAYIEALKNQEMAKLNVATQTPLIQLIDVPTLPLSKNSPNFPVSLIIFLFLSFIVTTVLIVLNKLIKDALNA